MSTFAVRQVKKQVQDFIIDSIEYEDEDEKEKYQQLLIEFQANAFFYIVLCRE